MCAGHTVLYSLVCCCNDDQSAERGSRINTRRAGGVGTALVQIAKWKGCEIFGTAGNTEKLEYLKSLGVGPCDKLPH